MTSLAIIVPTVGRRSLADLLESLAPQMQDGDRGIVVVDDHERYHFCCEAVAFAREQSSAEVVWRCWRNRGTRGVFGQGGRNWALDMLREIEGAPAWAWSIDDDDRAAFGALDMIRAAVDSGEASWYIFRMRGGDGTHFPGRTVPMQGEQIVEGNVGTPMLVFPSRCESRFGVGPGVRGGDPGYFGDLTMAVSLELELGAPSWRPEVICEVRPVAVEA